MRRVVVLALVCGIAAPAAAHQSSVSYGQVTVGADGQVDWTVRVSSRDLYAALGLERERDATDDEIRAGASRLWTYVLSNVAVSADGRPCPLGHDELSILRQATRFAVLPLHARCPLPLGTLALEDHMFFDIDPRHSGLVQVSRGGRTVTEEFIRGAERFEWHVGLTAPSSLGLGDFVVKGIEHIFTGYDHIAFILGLLLVAGLRLGALGYIVKVVTAFTIAHSTTLILASLDVVQLPSRLVESCIAASIVYVAAENLVVGDPRHRWPLAFGFGLVHGMGFAAMLRPLLPESGVVLPLLAFNVGVELGQLAIVLAVLPFLVVWARRRAPSYRRWALGGGSLAIGLVGLIWLVERLFDVRILP
jgi:hypothetical protein